MSVTVYRLEPATVTNRYGGTEKDWTDPTRTPIHDVKAAPWREGEDRGDGREGVVIGWTLFAPDGTSLAAGDRVEVLGEVCEIDGHPADWGHGFDWKPGIEVRARRVEG